MHRALSGEYGQAVEARALKEVEDLARKCASNFYAGGAGAYTVRTTAGKRNKGKKLEDLSRRQGKGFYSAQEAARATSPNYRAYNEADVEDAIGEVLASFAAGESLASARLWTVYAVVKDAEAFGSYCNDRRINGKPAGVVSWLRRNASRYTTGQRFGKTKVAVEDGLLPETVEDLALLLEDGRASCGSARETGRVCGFLRYTVDVPGLQVVVEAEGRPITWRSHVKLLVYRHLSSCRSWSPRSSSIDDLLQEPAGGDTTASPVLQEAEDEEVFEKAERTIRKFGALSGWQDRRTEAALVVLPYMLAGEDGVAIASRLNLVPRTVQRRMLDVQDALRPVFCPEDVEDEEAA